MSVSTQKKRPSGRGLSRQRIAEIRVECQNDPASIPVHREAVTEFLAANLPAEALPLLRRLASLCPDDTEIMRQLAHVHSLLGNPDDALAQWRLVRARDGESENTLHNLGVAACGAGEYSVACEAFEAKLALKPDCYETLNDLAVLYSLLNRPEDSAQMYLRCLEINPRYEKGRDNAFAFFWDHGRLEDGRQLVETLSRVVGTDRDIEEWRGKFAPDTPPASSVSTSASRPRVTGRRIAIVASSDAFLTPISDQLSKRNEVRVFRGKSREELASIMRWADLVWLEWCDGLAIEASRLPKTARIVCRLHSYEAFTDAPRQMNWANIDHLILVSETVGEILSETFPVPVPCTVIHNGIDPTRFPLVERARPGKKIASVGYINYKKNPSLLLSAFKAIHDWDPEFELHIAGEHQDPRIKVYFDHLLPRLKIPVTFHGWCKDMPGFYRDMDYVISTSLFESFHYSIAEGMLSGCLPLIHSWRGAERLYPPDCLFDTPADAIALIQHNAQLDLKALQQRHRSHIIEKYNWADRHEEIDSLLDSVLSGRKPAPAIRKASRIEFESKPMSDLDCGLVSIVIPTHNNNASLGETIDSALAQTYRHCEIIVCDDGSTDDTEHVLARCSERIKAVRQVQRGIPAALNHAIQLSGGRFIAPLMPGDRFAPDKIECQLRLLAADQAAKAVFSRSSGDQSADGAAALKAAIHGSGGNKPRSVDSPSCVLFDRSILDLTGWFDELVLQPAGERAIWDAMWRRMLETSRTTVDDTVRIDACPAIIPAQAAVGADSTAETAHERWRTRVRALSAPPAKPSDTPPAAHQRIVLVAAADPDGQLAMWAEALTRYAGRQTRLLTHAESKGLPSDLVLRRAKTAASEQKHRTLNETLAEAEAAIREADLIVFATGVAPGCLRPDARLEDTDEQPYGTLDWNELGRGKAKAAILVGTPSVRANLTWYRDRLAAKGWPVLTCEPDIHRWLPEAQFIPRLLVRTGESYPVGTRTGAPTAIVYPGKRDTHEGGAMMRETAARLKESCPDVMFGRYQDMPWREVIAMKSRAHIGIDRVSVGTGAFGMDSLENSALGLINVVYCDPYARALLAESIGTTECPWEMPQTPADLLAVLRRFASDPEARTARMRETQKWFDSHWNESQLARRVASVLEKS